MKGYDDQFSPPDEDSYACSCERGTHQECDDPDCVNAEPDDDGSWEAEQAEKAYHDGSRYGTDCWMPRGDG